MENYRLFDAEYKFMCVVWEREPVNSTELTRACQNLLGWKKSTTYTVIKKLCDRGMLRNENSTVSALVKREQVQAYESEALLEKAFDGSLPAFVAAFLRGRKLSGDEAEEIRRMIGEAER